MGYSFLEFMKRIGIFIICAQSFMHFAAGKSYGKYIKLLIGVMILAQFVVPVRALFLTGEEAEIGKEIERFQKEMEVVLENSRMTYETGEDTVDLLEKEMKEKLKEPAADYGCVIDKVRVEKDPPAVLVTVAGKEGESGKIKVEPVKPIKIETEEKKESIQEETVGTAGGENEEEMKKRFGIVLGIDESYIEIQTK